MAGWVEGDPAGDRRFLDLPGAFRPERGGLIPGVRVAYETWGTLDADGGNAVLVEHALTGDSHVVGSAGPGHPTGGWWDGLIGPGPGTGHRPLLRRLRQRAGRLPGDDRALLDGSGRRPVGVPLPRGDRGRPGAGRGRARRRPGDRPLGLRRRRLDGRDACAGVGRRLPRAGRRAVLPGLLRRGLGRPDRHPDDAAGRDPVPTRLGRRRLRRSASSRSTGSASPAGSRT